jgi:hypothetical protein
MFINVYLPCETGSADDWNTLHEIIANISNVIENSDATFIIVGGDLNVNCSRDTPHARVLNDFFKTYKLMPVNNMAPSAEIKIIEYTFCNEKLNQFSLIDYFCVSSSLQSSVVRYSTIDSASNHSDHLPLELTLRLPDVCELYKCLKNLNFSYKRNDLTSNNNANFRWDYGNIDQYYIMTGQMLYPIYNELNKTYDSLQKDRVAHYSVQFIKGVIDEYTNCRCVKLLYRNVYSKNCRKCFKIVVE